MTYIELLYDKINWKMVNMITDKFTKYEDIGLICGLVVDVRNGPTIHNSIYIYTYSSKAIFYNGKSHEYYNNSTPVEREIDYVKKAEFRYSIQIETDEEDDEDNEILKTEMGELKQILLNTNKLKYVGETNFGMFGFKEKE